MRFCSFFLIAVFLTAPVAAEGGEDAVAELIACGEVRGDKARLRCFERMLPAMRQAFPDATTLAEARAEEARIAAREEAKEEFGLSPAEAKANDPFEEKEFGAEDLPRTAKVEDDDEDDDEVDSIESRVVEVGKNLRGKLIVVLENGQVWRQISADQSTPYIPSNYEGTAEVKRGFMGSYVIRLSDTRDSFKARRVK